MKLSTRALKTVTLLTLASPAAMAEETRGFYYGAGAGYTSGIELELAPMLGRQEPLAAFAGFQFNPKLYLEGFYADIDTTARRSRFDSNLYTQSLSGAALRDSAFSTVASASLVNSPLDQGVFRPFTRLGLHYYDLKGHDGKTLRGDSLLFGAGADLDLTRRWKMRLEWEHYEAPESFDRDIFSARLEYRF